jgi:type VI protein secretion system component Hcp
MAERAKLNIGGKDFDLLHCSYSLRRDVDPKGRPSSAVMGGTVQLEVESTEDTSILEAMLKIGKGTKVTITFYKRDEKDQKMKELTLENAYVVQYTESLDSTGGNPMSINFVLSARTISIGNAKHENAWPDTQSN